MSPNINPFRILIGTVLFFIIIMVIQECKHRMSEDNLVKEITSYSDSASSYKNKYGQQVFENKTLVFNTEKQMRAYLATNDTMRDLLSKFKKLTAVTVIKSTTTIHDTVPIPFETRIPCDFKPFVVRRDCTHYRFKGIIFPDKFMLDSIHIPNTQNIVLGETKKGFLGLRRELTAKVLNSNPYVDVSNIGSFTNKVKKHRFGLGAYAGYGATIIEGGRVVTGPSAGISLNYNIVTF